MTHKANVLRLNAEAVGRLLETEGGPEFKIELQRAVLAEFVRKDLLRHASTEVRRLIAGLSKESWEEMARGDLEKNFIKEAIDQKINDMKRALLWNGSTKFRETRKTQIGEAVTAFIGDAVAEIMNARLPSIQAAVNKGIDAMLANADAKINELIGKQLEVALEMIIQEKIDARLKAIKESL